MDVNAEVVRAMKEKTSRGLAIGKIIAGVIGVLIIVFFLNPFVVVGAGERGVVLNFGAVQSTVFGEGLHFRIPFMQSIVKMDVKVHKSQVDAESVSKDLQDTHSTVAVNYHILPDKANWVYQNIGREYKKE
jgi:regulator of protease activity HflC (stomatin/prohibitin superfamily)